MNEKDLYKLFYKNKDYSGIKKIKNDFSDFRSFNIFAKTALYTSNIKEAYMYFNKAKNIYGCAYCKFIMEDIDGAELILKLVKASSPAVNWLLFLIEVIKDDITQPPTYFQLRNFYEQDLEMLFQYQKKDFIYKIIEKNSYMEYFNREIYKYTARVLLNNNYIDIAEKFLKKSLDICYKDPETHYILAELCLIKKDIQKAKQEFYISSSIVGEYLPAKNKLKDLSNGLYNLDYGVK